jgi:hypothetical protein
MAPKVLRTILSSEEMSYSPKEFTIVLAGEDQMKT